MLDFLRKGLFIGLGALSVTGEKAEQIAQELIKKGELTSEEAKSFVEQLIARGQEQKQEIKSTIEREFKYRREEWGLATKAHIAQLEARIKMLEDKLQHDNDSNTPSSD